MAIYGGSPECGHVSSMFVHNSDSTRWVEVGWYLSPGVYTCIPSAPGPNPKRLGFASNNGMNSCFQPTGTISTGTDSFNVNDHNQNAVWEYFHAGTNFWSSPSMVSFVTGIVLTNGERIGTDDSAKAEFSGLKRMNSSQQWPDWAGTHECTASSDCSDWPSDDPDWEFCGPGETGWSNIHTGVRQNGNC
ncbi:MAG: hypothetical protein ACRD1T_20010 [Acidimicrobiia bacterium]